MQRIPRGLAAEIKRVGYTSVYVMGVGDDPRPVKIGVTADPAGQCSSAQQHHHQRVQLDAPLWTAGREIARRIADEAVSIVQKSGRWTEAGWVDATLELARNAVVVAARKLNIQTFSHAEMLRRCQEIRRQRLERATGNVLTRKPVIRHIAASSAEYAPIDNVYPYISDDPRREKPGSGRRRRRRDKRRDHPFR